MPSNETEENNKEEVYELQAYLLLVYVKSGFCNGYSFSGAILVELWQVIEMISCTLVTFVLTH